MRFFIVLLLFAGIHTRSVPRFLAHGNPEIQQANVDRFLNKKSILNHLQAKIFGVDVPISTASRTDYLESKENPFLFEKDLILSEEQVDERISHLKLQLENLEHLEHPRVKRAFINDVLQLWPIPIPYEYKLNSGVNRQAIQAGLRFWELNTCLLFEQNNSVLSRIIFVSEDGCHSLLGRVGNDSQEISLNSFCTDIGTVTHEIAHALGVIHEQSRADRDEYIRLAIGNVDPSDYHNFYHRNYSEMNGFGVGYDHGSIMQYGALDFAVNMSQYVMLTLDTNYQKTIGSNGEPSFADVKNMNNAYCGSICDNEPHLKCQNNGYMDPKDCSRCRCPPAFGGRLCEEATDLSTGRNCHEAMVTATNSFESIRAWGAGTCYYVITGPPNTQIRFSILNMDIISKANGPEAAEWCNVYLEINYLRDFTYTGARFCNETRPTVERSQSNKLVVKYHGHRESSFTLLYRYV